MDNAKDGQVQDNANNTTDDTLKENLIADENNALDIEAESTTMHHRFALSRSEPVFGRSLL